MISSFTTHVAAESITMSAVASSIRVSASVKVVNSGTEAAHQVL